MTITKTKKRNKLTYPNTFYNFSDDEKQSYITYSKNKIASHFLLSKMQKIVNKTMEAYHNDFYVHDFYSILTNERQKNNNHFLWLVRPSGTYLINFNLDFLEDKETTMQWIRAILQNNEHDTFLLTDDKIKKLGTFNNLSSSQLINKIESMFTHKETSRLDYINELFINNKIKLQKLNEIRNALKVNHRLNLQAINNIINDKKESGTQQL